VALLELKKRLESIVTLVLDLLGDQVDFIVLFGSAATGHTHAMSDLDIGVSVSSPEARWATIFDDLLGLFDSEARRKTDLTLLNSAPLSLRFRVVRDGKLLYVKDEELWLRFVETVLTLYPDWKIYIENYLNESLEV
jgi:predicted nucleotidyltransferase